MKLADVRFNILPKTGAWHPVPPEEAKAPYVRFELRPILPGETVPVFRNGVPTGEQAAYPPGMVNKIVKIIHQADGSQEVCVHFGGAEHTPCDRLPGVDNQ